MADPVEDLLPLLGINQPIDGEDSDDTDSGETSSDDHEHDMADDDEESRHNLNSDDEDGQKARKKQEKPKKRMSQVIVTYDKSLTSAHSYLGKDLEDVRGRTILEENSVVTMPLLLLPGVVLVPGQVIPLQLYQQRLVAMVRRVADKDKTFGVVNMGRTFDDDAQQKVSSLGCTAEIFSMKEEMDEQSGISTVRVKARGRQRFRVEEIKHEITGDVMARVRILPEISLCHALDGARLPSHYKIMVSPPDDSDDMIKTAVDRQGRAFASVDLRRKSLVTKLYSANYTWWPPWVYKMYDIEWLAEQTRAELHSWCPTSLPDDPVDLSFWVAHNLPIDDELRLRLLQFDSVVQRLRFGLSIIRKTDVLLCCHSCDEKIASKNDVFGMSQEGPLGSYVNPGGYVHEMFTVTAVQNLNTSGRSSTEFSWFPGYAWTIINCKRCYSHMGWMFTATEKSLSPRKFWGLCRSSIKTNFSAVESEADSEENKLFIM